jgi:hypothetical protein
VALLRLRCRTGSGRVDVAPDRPDWLHEIKYDGYRMHARLDRGAVKLLTRTGLDWTHKYPLALGARPMAPSNIDLIYPVSISLGFAENCAMLPLQVDPCDRKRVVLGVAAKARVRVSPTAIRGGKLMC